MLTEEQILAQLDNYKWGYYCHFIDLGYAYSYLIDSRLNIFRGDNDRWAIAAERLGYNPRAGGIMLDICYYGNCLINLEHYNGQDTNYYTLSPIEPDNFFDSTEMEILTPKSEYWIVRGQQVKLSHNKQDYINANIELCEDEPNTIRIEEAARLAIIENTEVFRATNEELYKSLPSDLEKILVIDEWHHKDFSEIVQPTISDQHLKQTFDINKLVKQQLGLSEEEFVALFRQQETRTDEWNQNQWQDNRPSSYDTWQMIAKVITTGDTSCYKPTLEANTHWKNWPESGSL